MKVSIPLEGKQCKIYDNEGKDITELLNVRDIEVKTGVDRATIVILHCYSHDVDVEVEGNIVIKEIES